MKNDQFLVLFRLMLVSDQFDDFDFFIYGGLGHIWGRIFLKSVHWGSQSPKLVYLLGPRRTQNSRQISWARSVVPNVRHKHKHKLA